jgi:CRP/FNR family transcriptional regulator, anaerobic regulatory protein
MSTAASQTHIDLHALRKTCSSCSLSELCLPMGLSAEDMERLDALVESSLPMHADEHLFRVGDTFQAIYAVHSGCFKTYVVDDTGREHVLGFHLPGELMGLAGIYPRRHQVNALALDTSTVCKLSFNEISTLSMQVPSLQAQLFRLMSKDIGTSNALSGDYTAEERLAAFLMSISRRFHMRGYSATEFMLRMTRRDIANYLRLATETVSRVLAKFQDDGLISVDRREVKILDMGRLGGMCSSVPQL